MSHLFGMGNFGDQNDRELEMKNGEKFPSFTLHLSDEWAEFKGNPLPVRMN